MAKYLAKYDSLWQHWWET